MTQTADPAPLATVDPLSAELTKFSEGLAPILASSAKIVVTDATQVTEIKQARAARLQLREIRISVEKTRKAFKEESLQRGRKIDALAKHITEQIEPEEARLQAMEDFAELAEATRKEKRCGEREKQVEALGAESRHYNLMDMPDDTFAGLLKTLADARAFRIEEQRKLEEARRELEEMEAAERAAEAERHRKQFLENERLRKEALDQMAQLQAERQRAAEQAMAEAARAAEEKKKADEFFAEEMRRKQAEHDAQLAAGRAARAKFEEDARIQRETAEEKLRQERAAVDALQRKQAAELAKAQEAQRQAQAEAKRLHEEAEAKKRQEEAQAAAKAQAEAKAKADEEARTKAAKRLAALQPDKDKLLAYADAIRSVPVPTISEVEASDLLGSFNKRLDELVVYFKNNAKAL